MLREIFPQFLLALLLIIFSREAVGKLTDDQCIPGTSFKVHYSELIENHAIIGPILKSINARDDDECKDACFMNVPDVCYMFNYYIQSKKCELFYKDRSSEYKVVKRNDCAFKTKKCKTNSCQNGGQCYSLGDANHEACICKQGKNICQPANKHKNATAKEATTKAAATTTTPTTKSETTAAASKGITATTASASTTTQAPTEPPPTDPSTTAPSTTDPPQSAPQTTAPPPTAPPPTAPPGNVWIKVNTHPVCIGAKDNAFGRFYTTKKGRINRFRLIHISGGLKAEFLAISYGKWGTGIGLTFLIPRIEVHVTDKSNNRIAPPIGYPLDMTAGRMGYDVPGYDYNSHDLVFPEISPRMQVSVGDEYRIWYGADLLDKHEFDNSGQTCADVYVHYTKFDI